MGRRSKRAILSFKMKVRVLSESEGDHRNSNKPVFYWQIVLGEELVFNASWKHSRPKIAIRELVPQ
jgi:hypothetical protein